MTIYDLKPAFQNLLRPLARFLVSIGISANGVTLFALMLSIAQSMTIVLSNGSSWALLLMPLTLFIRMALNAIDGIMAKEFEQKSDIGAYLNELCDVISDAALYLSLAAVSGVSILWVSTFTIGAIISEYAGVLSWAIKGDRRYDGPLGKSDRAFFIGALSLACGLKIIPQELLTPLFIFVTILTIPTIYNRVKAVL